MIITAKDDKVVSFIRTDMTNKLFENGKAVGKPPRTLRIFSS